MTVFNGSSDIDATIAAPEVLAAFNKGGNAAEWLASADPSAAQKSEMPMAKSPCYRVETTIGFANGRRATSEVVIVLGDKAEPYRVLSWQDDVEPRVLSPVRRRS
jgi:general secretion pathway protein K